MFRSFGRVLVSLLIAVGTLMALPAVQAQQAFAPGAVVALHGTPHLWIADEQGVLHWGGDTRALAGKHVNWSDRTEVSLAHLRTLAVGDPWLSAGLLKDGHPIYLVKWETEWPQPRLLHIQSIADVELFGIDGSNYGNFVLDKATWEARYGLSAASLPRGELAAVFTQPPLDGAAAYRERGWEHAQQGDYVLAILDYGQAIRLDPNVADDYFIRGWAYAQKGDLDRAIQDYDQALRLAPNHAPYYVNRGEAYAEQGDYDRAFQDYDQAIRLDPNNASAYRVRSVAYANRGDYDRAIQDADQAIRLNPNDATAYHSRGWVYAQQGDYDRAIQDYDQAIRLDPNNASAYRVRSVAYANRGDYDRAIQDADQAIRLDPNLATACYRLHHPGRSLQAARRL